MDIIRLETVSLLPWKEVEKFQDAHFAENTDCGAAATFVGTMRDFNEGDGVSSMFLEHYPKMTEQQLQGLMNEANKQWPILHSLIIHRVGLIHPGEAIVLVAVWSAHRAAAFDACRYLMEALKSRAPFWKKEQLSNGSERWVAKNTVS